METEFAHYDTYRQTILNSYKGELCLDKDLLNKLSLCEKFLRDMYGIMITFNENVTLSKTTGMVGLYSVDYKIVVGCLGKYKSSEAIDIVYDMFKNLSIGYEFGEDKFQMSGTTSLETISYMSGITSLHTSQYWWFERIVIPYKMYSEIINTYEPTLVW